MKLSDLTGVGEKTLQSLYDLNLHSISDLLKYFPRKYEDRTKVHKIEEILDDENQTYLLKIKILKRQFIKIAKKDILKIYFTDHEEKYRAAIVIFSYVKSYLPNLLQDNSYAYIYGKFKYQYNELQTSQFELIASDIDEIALEKKVKESVEINKIVPIYSLSKFFIQKKFRQIISLALKWLLEKNIEDIFPNWIIEKYHFFPRKDLIIQLHFPSNFGFLKKAKNQYKYYEFFRLIFFIQYRKLLFEKDIKKKNEAKYKSGYQVWIDQVKKNFPFDLTEEQNQTLSEIEKDLLDIKPMYRLLQGDVGTGKTVVALLSTLIPIFNSFQVGFMVPTEILAYQHYQTLKKYLQELPINIGILVSSMKKKEKDKVLKKLETGEIAIVVGTHSLFGEKVVYNNLSMVIIDEQHRFGVDQRIRLIQKNYEVDILAMTATPIPRTFALTLYGDLDLSFIRKKPLEKVKIHSECVFTKSDRIKAYKKLKGEIKKGRQGYIICPLIKDSEKLNLTSIFTLKEELENLLLKDCRIALFYSEQPLEEKKDIMDQFLKGNLDILIATTIIEVGVDVQNANMMIIENSERFGLAQLHQLRGRIGRGIHDSYCVFIAVDSLTESGIKRLEGLLKYQDGFKLSEIDLMIRGPGEFFGFKQSGEELFKFSNFNEDKEFLYQAYEDIKEILRRDSLLIEEENKNLKFLYTYLEKKYFLHLTN